MEITNQQIEEYFSFLKCFLFQKDNILSPEEIKKRIKKGDGSGVYFIFDNGNLCYVGESGSLFGRLKDFHRTLNHTFRRSLGEAKYSDHLNYKKATSTNKFCDEIEDLLDSYIKGNIRISYKPILIGRKEFEDWMQEKHPEINFLNKRKRRK